MSQVGSRQSAGAVADLQPVAQSAIRSALAAPRCSIGACPNPPMACGLCRQHFAEWVGNLRAMRTRAERERDQALLTIAQLRDEVARQAQRLERLEHSISSLGRNGSARLCARAGCTEVAAPGAILCPCCDAERRALGLGLGELHYWWAVGEGPGAGGAA